VNEIEQAARKAFVDGADWVLEELYKLGAIQKRLKEQLRSEARVLMTPGPITAARDRGEKFGD
jgi:hypothetical protein